MVLLEVRLRLVDSEESNYDSVGKRRLETEEVNVDHSERQNKSIALMGGRKQIPTSIHLQKSNVRRSTLHTTLRQSSTRPPYSMLRMALAGPGPATMSYRAQSLQRCVLAAPLLRAHASSRAKAMAFVKKKPLRPRYGLKPSALPQDEQEVSLTRNCLLTNSVQRAALPIQLGAALPSPRKVSS